MLCTCYGAADDEVSAPPLKAGYVRVRLARAWYERQRWVEVRAGTVALYVDESRRRLVATLSLVASTEFVGDVDLALRMSSEAKDVASLRFDALDAKLEWWRCLRAAARGTPRSTSFSDDGATSPVAPRRASESARPERQVIWEAHGMCVCEDAEGSVSIEPRAVYAAKVAYGRLLRAFIRPPRADYDVAGLGPRSFVFSGRAFCRLDKQVRNARGRIVRYSVWRSRDEPVTATVVYAHGNASSRIEGISQLALALSLGDGAQFVALDCCGSGKSEGDFVSLGLKEQEDVVAVLDAERGCLGKVALWGRSMGAVTALLVASTRQPDLDALVIDSAYSNLKTLALDVARKAAARLPSFVAAVALRSVRDSVVRRAGFDIFDVDALKHVTDCTVPTFFICAADDTFVEPYHTAQLHDALATDDKELCVCPGTHNSTRPKDCYDQIDAFLRRRLGFAHTDPRFASKLHAELASSLSKAQQREPPNFAALSPWTIENIRARLDRRGNFSEEDDAAEDVTPRWLEGGEEEEEDVVQEMQDAALGAVRGLESLVG